MHNADDLVRHGVKRNGARVAKWRDQTSVECQADFDDLLDVGIDAAAERLSENWGLDPVAIVIGVDGNRRVVATTASVDDQYSLSETPIRDRLVHNLRAEVEQMRSYAIVANVKAGDSEADQLEVILEHREYAMQILIPYEMVNSTTFNLGTMRAAAAKHLVWS